MIVKVCGMREALNIRHVSELDIDWMGFIFYPKSSRFVDKVPECLPIMQKRVGVFVDADKSFILKHIESFGLHLVQLHGHETPDFCREIKETTGKSVIKAFGIDTDTVFDNILQYEGKADYFLFDTQCTTAGGSGRMFDHSLLQRYTGHTPFLLSGGIGPDSIGEIKDFAKYSSLHSLPFAGIDLNSRFEISPAHKAVGTLQEFIREVRE